MTIEIIGAIDQQDHFSADQITDLLVAEQTQLSYGEAFMGRPGTQIYAGQTEIVKIHSDLNLNPERARDYVNRALKQEQKTQVYHPFKTWFIQQIDDNLIIGNICPRLTPVHKLVNDPDSQNSEQNRVLLKQIYHYYFRVASSLNLRLDEGLSNFGVDENQQIYYLDDDLYSWDHFVSFAHFFGVLIRSNTWLDETIAQQFGNDLLQLIGEFFDATDTNIMVASKLHDIFIPDSNRRKVLDIIVERLQSGKTISKKLEPSKRQYLAIFADVHANLPALDAVLNFLKSENIRQGIVLGDTVGYGPHPAACIERLQDSAFTVIKGNHDHAAANGNKTRGMSSVARWCIDWSIPQLSTEHLNWLNDLPLELSSPESSAKKWLAMHGSPIDPNYFYAYVYEMTYIQNLDFMKKKQLDFCFHGHSHMPGIYSRTRSLTEKFSGQQQQSLASYSQSLICPGSVGQPRNNNTGAQLAIYDQQNHDIRFVTLDYSMDKILQDMQEFDFPETLIQRLRGGY